MFRKLCLWWAVRNDDGWDLTQTVRKSAPLDECERKIVCNGFLRRLTRQDINYPSLAQSVPVLADCAKDDPEFLEKFRGPYGDAVEQRSKAADLVRAESFHKDPIKELSVGLDLVANKRLSEDAVIEKLFEARNREKRNGFGEGELCFNLCQYRNSNRRSFQDAWIEKCGCADSVWFWSLRERRSLLFQDEAASDRRQSLKKVSPSPNSTVAEE